VVRGHPGAANFNFAGGDAIPGGFAFRVHDANLNKRSGPSLLRADVILLFVRPAVHVRAEAAGSADGGGFGHAPKMLEVQAKTIEPADELDRRSGAATEDLDGRGALRRGGASSERAEHGDRHGGD